jgi:arylsulfatase A-like enzyme
MRIAALASCAAAVLLLVVSAAAAKEEQPPHNVVVIVWDGMRPDFVREEIVPTLWKLSRDGVTFARHHTVYPTATEVNNTVLATGVYPRRSGLVGNWEYRPEIEPLKPVSRETPDAFQKGDALSGGKYLAMPTIAERVQAAGHRTAVAGTKWGTVLQDRRTVRKSRASRVSTVFFGKGTVPGAVLPLLQKQLGEFPPTVTYPNKSQDSWTTKALTQVLWREGVPRFSFLWLSDPDMTQHATAPGSPEALAAMKSSDARLAAVLEALEAKGARAITNLILVADHGFSTVERPVDVEELLREAGFAATKGFTATPKRGEVLVVANGGSVFFYVIDRDEEVTRRLIEWLQRSDYAGALFSRVSARGVFPLDEVQIDTRSAPDVVMSFRWRDAPNQHGVPGLIFADWKRKPGRGTHATFSRFDVHGTCIAAGPAFRRNFTSPYPSGNIDVAATVLHLLGIKPEEKLDGRVWHEALVNGSLTSDQPKEQRVSVWRDFETGRWKQYLLITRFGDTVYYSEANGSFTPAGE